MNCSCSRENWYKLGFVKFGFVTSGHHKGLCALAVGTSRVKRDRALNLALAATAHLHNSSYPSEGPMFEDILQRAQPSNAPKDTFLCRYALSVDSPWREAPPARRRGGVVCSAGATDHLG